MRCFLVKKMLAAIESHSSTQARKA